MCWNAKYAGLMLLSTFITWLSGIFIHMIDEKHLAKPNRNRKAESKAHGIDIKKNQDLQKRFVVFISFFANLGILFFFKYFNFFNHAGAVLFGKFSLNWAVPDVDVLLPVGISFYTFQALSYTMDVYRGRLKAEYHFGKYALFVSFFPQLVAGPIEQAKDLLPQFERINKPNYETIKEGLLLMGYGLFKKVMIADRVAILVNTVYGEPTLYGGTVHMVAIIFFAIQIYCDFSGYSDIAIGAAKVMGYDLTKNFDSPYFSRSIAEFWRRWHITLGRWFRDYLYIPLGGNRVKRSRQYMNFMIVFVVSGLWHGANATYVAWGFLHGVYQIIGAITKRMRGKIAALLRVDEFSFSHKLFQTLVTFLLVCFAWIFFRAENMSDALYIVQNLNFEEYWVFFDDTFHTLGLDRKEYDVAVISIGILFAVDWLKGKVDIFAALKRQHIVFRWLVYFILIFGVLIYGSYGKEYNAADFIYFQF
jgi:D-alanyl-lipoteichoic acid acyltransferase DltB (MBOAT superfamily)